MKDKIIDFIRLFVPADKRRNDSRIWADTIIDMFTKGYCYEFAKALKIAFGEKYPGRIIGTGNMGLMKVHTEKEWNKKRRCFQQAIRQLDFQHFMYYVKDRGAYDITGRYQLICFGTRLLLLFNKSSKDKFLEDLQQMYLREFKKKYLGDTYDDLKLVWMCTEKDLKLIDRWVEQQRKEHAL